MVEIIKTPKPKNRKCPLCKTRFKYEPDDIKLLWPAVYFVPCPKCGYRVEVKSR